MGMNLDAGAHPGPVGNCSPHAPPSGGAPTSGRCPDFSTTALQDLGLQPQRHPSTNNSPAPHHVGASL